MAGYYVVKVKSIFDLDGANPAINVFTYSTTESAPTQAGAEVLLAEFKDTMFTAEQWQDCVNEATLVGDIEIIAPQVPAVLVVDSESFPGNTVGQYLPLFNAAGFYAPRTRGDIRQGKKRIGIISEANQTNGEWESSFTPFLSALAVQFGLTITQTVSSVSVDFVPVIVKRIPYTAPSGRTAYRLPEAGDALVMAAAPDWEYQPKVTTQNTRKR